VLDPTENNERIRIVETADPWAVEVDWCICGPFAAALCGCWCVQVFIDDIDGVGPTSGLLGSTRVDVKKGAKQVEEGDDTSRRCYEYTFVFPAGSVGAGIYDLVVVITLASDECEDDPKVLLQDTLGFAQIPVLAFFDDNTPFCPEPAR
jgi:hypothetical protein